MQTQWRNPSAWTLIGGERRVPAPVLPPRPTVRVRALARADGSPSFRVAGEPAQPGEIVNVDRDDALRLVACGKAEYV